MSPASAELQQALTTARAWPFEEARKLVERFRAKPPEKGYVLFETGYGPSGLPHIGTFGEVVRTSMVRHAFEAMSDIPTRLFCFSDDMDGLRKVPDNIPNKELVAAHLGKSLTTIPDPFGTHDSFGHHNNARLRGFLDSFGFQYEFQSATDWYKSGRFDQTLLEVLRHYDEIMALMLPTLGEERQGTYSPFLPISPTTGKVLQVPLIARDADAGTITYKDEDGTTREVPVTGGHCKLQWKPDWAMRWVALGVDYEMSGKDLIPSVQLGQKIARILGGNPPEGFTYELFLDEDGGKISKSKGNGLAVEEWLHYAPPESLALYMYQQPRRAKRLYFDVIPRAVDEYITFAQKYPNEAPEAQIENPVWHIHNGNPPTLDCPLTFGMLQNLASVANADDPKVLWGFISRYATGATAENSPFLGRLAEYAVHYYQDRVKPKKQFRAADDTERAALTELSAALANVPADSTAEALQTEVYEIGKRHPFPELKDWFKGIYAVLLGQSEGPRMGSFIQLYGIAETRQLIDDALAGKFLNAA
ncbi:MAG TPA: lysine--tRNA ligase [Alphaproteobacteria bacterium]|jgi:lysyl-tRNA synthetase class 1|nr:lysine--tRNA ligase [Alphaproteobacteria bacterium]